MKHKRCIIHLFNILLLAFIVTVCNPSEKQKDEDELSKKLQALVDSMIVVESDVPILSSCSKNSENSVVEPDSGTPIGTWCATRIDGSLEIQMGILLK